jgi:prolyl-tRNA synthetase
LEILFTERIYMTQTQTQSKKRKYAISPTREENYPEWYQQVIKAAELAESSPVRGCMIIKPWGYGIWESIQRELDRRIKATGHENVYFPLFIPLSFFEKEAAHVEGFAKECAVVTHTRLEEKDGGLVPAGELDEPLIVRPTSETIIGDAFSRWVQSYRDLPLLINQWANVVRWEMRTRLFLRTTEFLWQEGHTAHATADESQEETLKMLEVYRSFSEDVLAMPVFAGEKTPSERFPGAERTYCIEAMMQDRKALQAGTSHNLGQNFAKASNITFCDVDGQEHFAHTSSWGVATRLVGGVIMTHSDDDGLRLPPRIAAKHIVIIPVVPKPHMEEDVFAYAEKVAASIRGKSWHGDPVVVTIDKRDMRGGEKTWDWIKRGIPIRIEVGPRDIESQKVMLARRDCDHKDKQLLAVDEVPEVVLEVLSKMQKNYFEQALAFQKKHTVENVQNFEELKAFFTPKNLDKPEIHGGFVKAKWCEDPETEALLDPLKVTIRCIPMEQSGTEGLCIITGRPATLDVILAKSY